MLYDRLRQIAFLNKGIKLLFTDERMEDEVKRTHTFLYEGGLKEYIAFLNKNKTPIHEEIIYVEGEQDGIQVEIAMQYNDGYVPNVYSFCNNINTGEGGTHEEGFKLALNRTLNNYAKEAGLLKKDEEGLQSDDVREGRSAIISVKHRIRSMKARRKPSWATSKCARSFPTFWANSWNGSYWKIRTARS